MIKTFNGSSLFATEHLAQNYFNHKSKHTSWKKGMVLADKT